MIITDNAKQLLENFLKEKGKEGIRLTSIAGCCGSEFTINLSSPMETDKIEIINGIKVAFDSQVTGTEELTLDIEEGKNGSRLVLIGGSSCC
ncbi:iron-sulfur cluster biosynthesis family protein [Niallia sp. XMNu-256]|uniref:adhesin n=1 Tax=Niallia sp. XMNu-256 TaxID=3082444 RepID=UPI0030CD4FE7